MASDRWYENIESQIFTVVSYRIRTALDGSVSKTIKFTTEAQSQSTPYFPTCFIHEMAPIEEGQDLDGTSINAVSETIEVSVYARSRDECKLILNEAIYQMKRLSFDAVSMQLIDETDKVYTGTCRFRRLIGADDILIETA